MDVQIIIWYQIPQQLSENWRAWAELIPQVNKAVQKFVNKELKSVPYSTQVGIECSEQASGRDRGWQALDSHSSEEDYKKASYLTNSR